MLIIAGAAGSTDVASPVDNDRFMDDESQEDIMSHNDDVKSSLNHSSFPKAIQVGSILEPTFRLITCIRVGRVTVNPQDLFRAPDSPAQISRRSGSRPRTGSGGSRSSNGSEP